MTTRLLALIFLAGSSLFARSHWVVQFGIGSGGYGYGAPAYYETPVYYQTPAYYYAPPPPAPVVTYVRPHCPGAGYRWVPSYWSYRVHRRYAWHAGYWARPPYARSYWVRPRYYRGRFYEGYWRR